MARLGTQFSPTGRDRSHAELGVLRANFQALLDRRGIQNYAPFIKDLKNLNKRIQELRWWNSADIMAHGWVESARQDMILFFDQFIDRVQSNPQWILAIARAINSNLNIEAFNESPAAEFEQQAFQETIQQLREGGGPFNELKIAVEQSQNTDLFILFSLYSTARAALQRATNPQQAHANDAQLVDLERQRALLTRINDELAWTYEAFNRQEAWASLKTWWSRAASAVTAAAIAAVMGGVKLPSFSTWSDTPVVNVSVNLTTSVTLGHTLSRMPDGSMTIAPAGADKATEIKGVKFQFDRVTIRKDGKIIGTLHYQLPDTTESATMQVHDWVNKLSNGKDLTLLKLPNGLQVSYDGVNVVY